MRVLAALLTVLVLAGSVTEWAVRRARRSGWRAISATLDKALAHGSLPALLQARLIAGRVTVSEPEDHAAAARLAFTSAYLTRHYGLDLAAEAAEALAQADASEDARAAAVGAAARVLLASLAGQLPEAQRLAAQAMRLAPETVEPLLALADLRAAAGDLRTATKMLEAAMVLAPEHTEPRVAWAEARLDLGDPETARQALRQTLADAPDHTRAWLLLAEAEAALSVLAAEKTEAQQSGGEIAALAEGCQRDAALSPTIAIGCALELALRARRRERQAEALGTLIEALPQAAKVRSPRVLARAAQLAAQLGLVDRAEALADRARALGAEGAASLAWARLAIALGRGEAAAPLALPATHPELAVIAARATLATGGPDALAAMLGGRPPGAAQHPQLALLGVLAAPEELARTPDPKAPEEPFGSYVSGLRARLRGDLPRAAETLRRALTGHGDACRALGEYLDTLRALGQPPDLAALEPLRRTNARCANLPGIAAPETTVTPRPRRRRR